MRVLGFAYTFFFAKWYLVRAKRHSLPNHVLFLGLTLSDCVELGTSSVRLCEVIKISAIWSQMKVTDSSVWEALFVLASSKILHNSWILFLSRLFSKLTACFGFHFGFPVLRFCLRDSWHLCDFGHLKQRFVVITEWQSCYKDHIYDIPLTVYRYFSMLSIVGIFGCANVLELILGYDEICRYIFGYAKICWYLFWFEVRAAAEPL